MLHTSLCAHSTGNAEDRRQCLSRFFREWGKTKGGPGAVSQVQKPAEEKGKYGLLHSMCVCVGSGYRNKTHGT